MQLLIDIRAILSDFLVLDHFIVKDCMACSV